MIAKFLSFTTKKPHKKANIHVENFDRLLHIEIVLSKVIRKCYTKIWSVWKFLSLRTRIFSSLYIKQEIPRSRQFSTQISSVFPLKNLLQNFWELLASKFVRWRRAKTFCIESCTENFNFLFHAIRMKKIHPHFQAISPLYFKLSRVFAADIT